MRDPATPPSILAATQFYGRRGLHHQVPTLVQRPAWYHRWDGWMEQDYLKPAFSASKQGQFHEECWIKCSPKHYQRQKYWCPAVWFETSCLLPVDGQLDTRQKNAGSSVLASITSVPRIQLSVQRSLRSKSRSFGNIHANFPSTPWGESVVAMLIEAPTNTLL